MEFKDVAMILEDYIDFNMFHNKKRLIVNTIIFSVIFTLFAVILNTFRSFKYNYVYVIVGLLTLGLMNLVNISSIKKLSRKQFNSSKAMQSPATLVINNQEVSETSSFGSVIYKWSDLTQAVESKKGIYLYFSELQAFLIPKRILTQQKATHQ